MSEKIYLHVGNVYTQVEACRRGESCLKNILSYEVENAEAIRRVQYKRTGNRYWLNWPGTKSFYDQKNKRFLTGLLSFVVASLQALKVNYEIHNHRRLPPNLPADCSDGYTLHDGRGGLLELYDYQRQVCESLLQRGRGVAKLATGAGKTECAIAMVKALDLPTLFLTHQISLLHQTAQRFKDRLPTLMSGTVGIIGDGIYSPGKITVATVQTLYSLLKSDKAHLQRELAQYRFLIIDEAHRSGAKQFHEVACLCENAYFRLGLTATPFMANNTEADMYLKGITGNIISEVSNQTLIDQGLLAQPYFMFLNVKQPADIAWVKDYHEAYDKGIVNNAFRNALIAQKIKSLQGKGYRPLVVVHKLQHGHNILQALRAEGLKGAFLSGGNDYAERMRGIKALASGKVDAIIATNIFDEGVDVKEINCVVLAAGNKSAPAIYQRTGRAIRKKADGGHALVIDFIDMIHDKLYQHSKERFEVVSREPGFKILGQGE